MKNRMQKNIVAAIVGSSFNNANEWDFEELSIATPYGSQKVYKKESQTNIGYLLYRHGLPHQLLPNQINYPEQIWALRELGCKALLSTSSVGVLTEAVPLFKPLLLDDLLMLDNRLPKKTANQGHLVLREGLFSKSLNQQILDLSAGLIAKNAKHLVFGYFGGPRTKTSAENRMFQILGAQVNSMTLAPEIILANEFEIPCSGLVVGHKYSLQTPNGNKKKFDVAESLESAKAAFAKIILAFLQNAQPVKFGNEIFVFK
jgi:purine nucleoside phosphorylase